MTSKNAIKQLKLIVVTAISMTLCITPASHAQEKPDSDSSAEPRAAALAEIKPEEIHKVAPRLPLWEAGLFGLGVTQAAYPGADERVSLLFGLPYMIYRGEYLRVDRGTVGVRAIKTPRTELDIGFAASLGSRAEDIEARRGMEDLGTLLEFGPRLKINLGDVEDGRSDSRIQLPLRSVLDASDHLAYRGLAFEPQWVVDIRLPNRWYASTNLGALFGDQKLADTFYRVAPSEATTTRPEYEAKSGLIALRASLFLSHPMTPDVRFFSYLRLDSVKGAANYDSPLVQRDYAWAAGVGLAWTLARSERSAID